MPSTTLPATILRHQRERHSLKMSTDHGRVTVLFMCFAWFVGWSFAELVGKPATRACVGLVERWEARSRWASQGAGARDA